MSINLTNLPRQFNVGILAAGFVLCLCLFYGCGGVVIDNDFEKINAPLTYQQLLGTYVFKPDTFQARKLKLNSLDTIILKITDDSLNRFGKDSIYMRGKYYINKMILAANDEVNKPYSGMWMFYYLKSSVPNTHTGTNYISFILKRTKNNDINFDIGKDPNGVLHIAGYMWDPKYEVIKVIDFKKVK